MAKYRFEAMLVRPEGIGTWTYLGIPLQVSEAFGRKGQVKVKGTINGHPFMNSALPHGDGRHYLVVNATIRDAIRAQPGDVVHVVMQEDKEPRTVTLADDVRKRLKSKKAIAAFDAMSYSHQKEYVDYIADAKRPETRERRIDKVIVALLKRDFSQNRGPSRAAGRSPQSNKQRGKSDSA